MKKTNFSSASTVTAFLVFVTSLLLSGCQPPVRIDPSDPLEQAGPYSYNQKAISIAYAGKQVGNIDASLYLPEQTPGAVPAVVFVPGFGAKYSLYNAYFEHLASHGYAVLAMNVLGPAAAFDSEHDDKAQQVISAVQFLSNSEADWAQQLDTNRIAAAGHSQGGKLAFYAAALEPAIKHVLALDPVNAGGPPCFIAPEDCANYPVAPNPSRQQTGLLSQVTAGSLILRSQPDAATNPEAEFNASWFFLGYDGLGTEGVPSPALYVDMLATPHADYVTSLPNLTNQFAKRFMLAWLQHYFDNVDRTEYLTGTIVQRDQQAGYLGAVLSR